MALARSERGGRAGADPGELDDVDAAALGGAGELEPAADRALVPAGLELGALDREAIGVEAVRLEVGLDERRALDLERAHERLTEADLAAPARNSAGGRRTARNAAATNRCPSIVTVQAGDVPSHAPLQPANSHRAQSRR